MVASQVASALGSQGAARWLFRAGMRETLEAHGACSGCLGLVDLGAAVTAGDEEATAQAIEPPRRGALAVLAAGAPGGSRRPMSGRRGRHRDRGDGTRPPRGQNVG